MILKEIQNFLINYHRVSLPDMERHFKIDRYALKPMLNKLIKKGRVRKSATAEKCHGCKSCDPDALEFYEWIDQIQAK